jgi:hypothetical protein
MAWKGQKPPKLVIPYYPSDDDKGHYSVETLDDKFVIDYTKLNILEISELNIVEYWQYLRDSYIHQLNQTEEGRKYLENCWIMTQTKPDKKALREQFGK